MDQSRFLPPRVAVSFDKSREAMLRSNATYRKTFLLPVLRPLGMPKKTKKQKAIAERHRSIFQSQVRSTDQQPHTYTLTPVSSLNDPVRSINKPAPAHSDPSRTPETAAIRTDLIKTLLLATLAFAVELSLYYLWEVR